VRLEAAHVQTEPVDHDAENPAPKPQMSLKLLDISKRDKWSVTSFDNVERTPRGAKADGAQEYIAVCCAGGGARAQAFATGVLAALYETPSVTVSVVSAVSGGTWAGVGLELWRQQAVTHGQDPRIDKEWIYRYILHTTEKTSGASLCDLRSDLMRWRRF
jgi:predicted acylesterase/phospholipase RssA